MSSKSSPLASTTSISISNCVALKGIGYSANVPLERQSQYISVQVSSLAMMTTARAASSNPPSVSNRLFNVRALDARGNVNACLSAWLLDSASLGEFHFEHPRPFLQEQPVQEERSIGAATRQEALVLAHVGPRVENRRRARLPEYFFDPTPDRFASQVFEYRGVERVLALPK